MKATLEFDLDDAKEAKIYHQIVNSLSGTQKTNVQKATRILSEAVGNNVKLSPSEKAKLAAKTRWDKVKLAKDAEEKKLTDFQTEEVEENVEEDIDGREILEERYTRTK